MTDCPNCAAANALVAQLREALGEAGKFQPKALRTLRDNGFVFKTDLCRTDLTEAGRWEKLAFTLYTDLCEIENIARNALLSSSPASACQHVYEEVTNGEAYIDTCIKCGSSFPGPVIPASTEPSSSGGAEK